MKTTFDPTLTFTIARADLYPHTRTQPEWDANTDIEALDVTIIEVDVESVERHRVTLAATTRDHADAYGVELDLEPHTARLLARQLLAAADASDELSAA